MGEQLMSARPRGGEARKVEILNAAEEVFAKKGIANARMDDIAQQTRFSKGTLYIYFESKESLIIAILERMFAGAFKRLEKRAASESSAENALLQFTEDAIRGYKNMLRMTPMVFEFLSLAFRNKIVQKAMKQYLNAYMKSLVPIIRRGIDTKEFRQVDAQEVAIAAGAILEGTVLLWAYDRKLVDVERHIRSGVRLLFDGILAPA
jgi:AcrR family transcriptional regulator